MKTILYTVSIFDKEYCSPQVCHHEKKFYGMRLLLWTLSTDQHLLEATKPFGIHREDLPNVKNKSLMSI